ncbi:MAG: hypothetical protein NT144_14405, partial [Bacteroidia bacterium]|nr:hypothetical protein [Bacteroidia bacterium]
MKQVFKFSLAILLLFIRIDSASAQESQTLIFKEFENPPHEYSILPFWGWNGTLKENEIKRQIDMMLDKGIY